MSHERPSYYGILPANVRYCPDLKPNAKIFFTEITALADQHGFCFASNGYFADLYEVDPLTISRWISQLQKLGFVKIRVIDGQRQISIGALTKKSRGVDKKIKGGLTKKSAGVDEKINHSTKSSTTRLIDDDGAKKSEVEADENVFTPGPRERQLFEETEWAADGEKWRLEMIGRGADLGLVDLEWYRGRAAKWSRATGARNADWPQMVDDWIVDDQRKGKLKLKPTNSTQQHETNRPNTSSNGNGNIDRAIARAERLAHKFGDGGGNE